MTGFQSSPRVCFCSYGIDGSKSKSLQFVKKKRKDACYVAPWEEMVFFSNSLGKQSSSVGLFTQKKKKKMMIFQQLPEQNLHLCLTLQ